MKFKSWDNTKEIELLNCPFCDAEPKVSHIGNEHTKKCMIEIKCPKYRIKRTDAVLRHEFDFLEKAEWRKRMKEKLRRL